MELVQVKEKMRHKTCQVEYWCSGGNDSLIQKEEKLTGDTYPLENNIWLQSLSLNINSLLCTYMWSFLALPQITNVFKNTVFKKDEGENRNIGSDVA